MEYPSDAIAKVVEALAQLPGIGRKTALRMALQLLKDPYGLSETLGHALIELKTRTQYCQQCFNISDGPRCNICLNTRRNDKQICVVEDVRDLMAIERTGQYQGQYHLLGGLIHPMNGTGPSDLNIDSLVQRVHTQGTEELILALSSTMEGETTAFYIVKKLRGVPIRMTNIARGIPMGSDLAYTDELTLGRSLMHRTDYLLPTEA
ncbi:MAG: recombination mediator RecR [Bacteroidetes bacterium]|jgi:recombination protein RecR|nr:recombination mediator RecR [Bacteroidota bacterium]